MLDDSTDLGYEFGCKGGKEGRKRSIKEMLPQSIIPRALCLAVNHSITKIQVPSVHLNRVLPFQFSQDFYSAICNLLGNNAVLPGNFKLLMIL